MPLRPRNRRLMLLRRSILPRKKKRRTKRKRRRRRRSQRRAESLNLRPLKLLELLLAQLVNKKKLRLLQEPRKVLRKPLMMPLLRPRRLQNLKLNQNNQAAKSKNYKQNLKLPKLNSQQPRPQ